jgi:outer membrane protein, multidrug efflux system
MSAVNQITECAGTSPRCRWLAAFGVTIATCLIGGCTPGSAYVRPNANVPAAYRGATDAGTSAVVPNWTDIYPDPVLQELIRHALEHNFDVGIAAARVGEARALFGVSRTQLWPQIDAIADAFRGRVSQIGTTVLLPGESPTANVFEPEFTLSYEVDLWGQLRQSSAAAKADLLGTEYAQRAVIVGLVASIAEAYYNLRVIDASRTIVGRTAANRERALALSQSLYQNGAGTRLDLWRAKASLLATQSLLPDLVRQAELAENQLRVLLGDNPAPIDRASAELGDLPVPVEVPSGLPSRLLEQRPDIEEAEAALIASHARWRAARAALLPTIELTGAIGSQSIPLKDLFTQPTKTWSIGLGLIEPILSSARNQHTVDASAAREQAAALQYQKAVQQAFREVSDALIARTHQLELEAALGLQIDALSNVHAQAERRFRIGSATYFEVVDSDRDLLAAKLAAVRAKGDSLLALVHLYRALGGGWSPVAS